MYFNMYWVCVISISKTNCVYVVQEIQLTNIVKVELSPSSTTHGAARHVFEMHTGETLFYVGERCTEKDRQSGGAGDENGCGIECAQRMAKAIRRAWLPVTSEPSDSKATGIRLSSVYCSIIKTLHCRTG